jgi:hypothetical protein
MYVKGLLVYLFLIAMHTCICANSYFDPFFFMCVQFTDFKFYGKISNYLKHASAGIFYVLI